MKVELIALVTVVAVAGDVPFVKLCKQMTNVGPGFFPAS
jgi:hypothetical protein